MYIVTVQRCQERTQRHGIRDRRQIIAVGIIEFLALMGIDHLLQNALQELFRFVADCFEIQGNDRDFLHGLHAVYFRIAAQRIAVTLLQGFQQDAAFLTLRDIFKPESGIVVQAGICRRIILRNERIEKGCYCLLRIPFRCCS